MSEEILTSAPITKDELKPVVAHTLSCMARNNGCLTVLTAIFRKNMPEEGARMKLERNDDWSAALKEISEERRYWAESLRQHLTQMPAGYTRTPEYQKELSSSLGPKLVRFYTALNLLMLGVMTEEEVQITFGESDCGVRSESYADRVLRLANFLSVQEKFAIPNSARGQFELVSELGAEIFPRW